MRFLAAARGGQRTLTAAGVGLLLLWSGLWLVSVSNDRLAGGQWSWLPSAPFLGCDFDINYYATRTWIGGGDPYLDYCRNGSPGAKYDHPPLVLPLFAWCNLLPRRAAVLLWLVVQAGIAILAGVACWRTRRELGSSRVPLPLVLAAVLLSFPVLFEMERGNWNSLVLLLLLLAARSLRGRTLAADLAAGLCIGLAAWIKMYPGLLFLALLALRRWRAAAVCGTVGLLIGLASLPYALQFRTNIEESCAPMIVFCKGAYVTWYHSLSASWPRVCADVHCAGLARRLPGTVGWALLVLPMAFVVSYRVARAADPSRLLYPYFLWLTAAATYLPLIANDYNLLFLPLAALAVWDRRDRVAVHVVMAAVLIWWQPFALPVSPQFLFYCKLVGLGVVAVSLGGRAQEQAGAKRGTEGPGVLERHAPAAVAA
jgi:hypothetical protein